MPELPEVEFARRLLERALKGATIERVAIEDARILDQRVKPRAVITALSGRRVQAVERRGKWLRIVLDRGLLFSHLGMTGKWTIGKADDPPVRFEKARLVATKRARRVAACFSDPRLFGRFVVASEDLDAYRELGPDPLHDGVDADRLHAKLARRKLPIKPTLLDQALLAGVGNIQATDALFMARIDPRRASSALSRREVGALARAIVRSIERTLELEQGDTIQYVEEPGADNPFIVYGRGGDPCPKCKRALVRIVQAGRATVFCSRCQR